MAPAEIWQGGNLINVLKGNSSHTSRFDGREVVIKDSDDKGEPGCILLEANQTLKTYISPGNSVTLEQGEIVKSIE
jgi:hypothetical protein